MNLRPPSVTVSTHTSASNSVAFQSHAMPNARMTLCMPSVHYFSFPPRPLRTAPSRFPNTTRFGSHPPLIPMREAMKDGYFMIGVLLGEFSCRMQLFNFESIIYWRVSFECGEFGSLTDDTANLRQSYTGHTDQFFNTSILLSQRGLYQDTRHTWEGSWEKGSADLFCWCCKSKSARLEISIC